MSDSLSEVIGELTSLNNEEETGPDVLNKTFDTCTKLYDFIQDCSLSSSDENFQDAVKLCIKGLERCTSMVNELCLFSTNETIEEVQTSSIKYLMLPALLGSLNLSVQSKELPERLKNLKISEVYFKDFLLRCKNYELSKQYLTHLEDIFEDSENGEVEPRKQNVADLIAARENKIKQYKLKKELTDRAKELKPSLQRSDLEEYTREYYLVTLEKWIVTALEEIENVQREKSMLKTVVNGKEKLSSHAPKKSEPLKPIIITRNEIQKKVFGYGYPSLPVLTIDDFYRMRFEKEIKEQKNNSSKSLQERASAGESLSKEEEEIQKEMLLDKDDIEALRQARAWDDWKDDNPRGSGNRYNKG